MKKYNLNFIFVIKKMFGLRLCSIQMELKVFRWSCVWGGRGGAIKQNSNSICLY